MSKIAKAANAAAKQAAVTHILRAQAANFARSSGVGSRVVIMVNRRYFFPLLEVPAEIYLYLAYLLTPECKDFGVAKAMSVGLGALVGRDDLVANLDESLECKANEQFCVGPAALEILLAIDSHVGGAVEDEVVA